MKKGFVDRLLEKTVSRKLLVFGTATGLLIADAGLDAATWGWIALVYIGTQVAIDAMKAYKGFDR